MRLYLAGPMRGYPEFNFPAFRDATAKLRKLGHEVFSPAEKDEDDGFRPGGMKGDNEELTAVNFDLNEALAMDLVYVCKHAEAVVVLPDWDKSPGANAEIAAARALHKPVWPLANVLRGDEGIMNEAVKFLSEKVPPLAQGWEFTPTNHVRTEAANPAIAAGILFPSTFGRNFETGAYRDSDDGKPDYEGFLSPAVLTAFADYMHSHRTQSDGRVRASDNWQKGIPRDVYMKSMWRHFMDVWADHRNGNDEDVQLEALMALLFNVQGYAHEILSERSIVGD